MIDANALLHDPELLPYRLDPVLRRVLWLRMPQAAREMAAFLDERAMPPSPEGAWAPATSLDAMPAPPHPAHAIFHISHCGSTLLSRVLDAVPGVQSLREPLPLRTLADAWRQLDAPTSRLSTSQGHAWLAGAWRAYSRPLGAGRQVIVKPTSRCTSLADAMLGLFGTMRVVLLDMPLRPWLATLFKSDASLTDVASAAEDRLAFLHARGLATDLPLHMLDVPAQCALGWLAEQLRFAELAAGPYAARVLRIDFEELLADPADTIGRVCAHFELAADASAAALASPHWQRYSKAPEHAYRANDRRHDLALAMARRGADVDAGIGMVHRVVQGHDALARTVRARLG